MAADTILRVLRGVVDAREATVRGSEDDRAVLVEWQQEGRPHTASIEPDIDDRGMFLSVRIEEGVVLDR